MLRVAVNVCVALAWVETADCLVSNSICNTIINSVFLHANNQVAGYAFQPISRLVSNKSIDWQLALNFTESCGVR